MEITKNEIEDYICIIKQAYGLNRYRFEVSDNREANRRLVRKYIINEQVLKEIIMDLKVEDFSEILKNNKPGFEHERLYVFGKKVKLLERFGEQEKEVSLYIKTNKLDDNFVIIVSLHEEEYPVKKYFK